jgi:hypothetical protein
MLKFLLSSAFFFGSFLLVSTSYQMTSNEFNPTGTYEYDNGDDGDGIVKVKKISSDKIMVSIFVIGGPPSHNMGEFIKELKIKNGVASYKSGDCGMKFTFNSKAVKVVQSGFDCGFGNGVSANGYYLKTSSKTPEMKDY